MQAQKQPRARAGVFFVYEDECDDNELDGLRLRRKRLTIDVDAAGRFEGLRVCGFDEATEVYRFLINGRRVWSGVAPLGEDGFVASPSGERWHVGLGTVIEVWVRGRFERLAVIVQRDPAPVVVVPAAQVAAFAVALGVPSQDGLGDAEPAPPCGVCSRWTLVDVPRVAFDPSNPHHPTCPHYVRPEQGVKS